MNEFYENIKNSTECSECNGKEMGITYLYESSGAVKKPKSMMGLRGFTGAGNMLMIACKSCGFVAKSFVIAR